MTKREEIVRYVAEAYAVTREQWDGQNYPYQQTVSLWDDSAKAFDVIQDQPTIQRCKYRITLRHLDVLDSGRITWSDIKTVYQDEKWVDESHDPRYSDPDFRRYIELKERFEK